MFGVFIQDGKLWRLHCVYSTLVNASQERDYLVKMLGVRARVFSKL